MIPLVLTFLLKGLLVLLVARLLPGVHIRGFGSAIGVAVVYGLLTALFQWALVVLSLPLVILSFGLFMLVINGFLLWLTDKLIVSFRIDGFMPLALATVLITVGDIVVHSAVGQIFRA